MDMRDKDICGFGGAIDLVKALAFVASDANARLGKRPAGLRVCNYDDAHRSSPVLIDSSLAQVLIR